MPNRKKFNARFPPARIKKIMRTDKEVGKVAAPVPAVISRALELFAQHLLQQAGDVTVTRGSRTLSPAHLKQCIQSERRFDFLKDLVAAVPDAAESQQEVGDARSPELAPGPAPAPCDTPGRDPDESEPRRKYLKTESSCVSASSANGAHAYSAPVSDRPPVPDLIHASQLRLSGGHISADSRLGFPAPAAAHMPFPGAGLLAYPDGLFPSPTPPPAHQGSAPALAVSYGSLPDPSAGDTL